MIDNYIDWKLAYKEDKRAIWIRVALSGGEEYYFKYSDFKCWYEIKEICENNCYAIETVKIQYKSNQVEIDTLDCEGVYLVRSIVGRIGGDSIDTLTVGQIYNGEVHKEVYSTPDLLLKDKSVSKIEDCFQEAIILW